MEASAFPAPARLGLGSGTSRFLRLRSDEQLVGLFRAGSEEAFDVIHDRYRQRLSAYARQMLGSGADAEDVIQDVFLRAYRALRVDERPLSLRAWLYRVAHNRCIDALRRPAPAPHEIFEVSRLPIPDTPATVERREDLQRLVADVRRLPDQQRSALLMREMDGMSYHDLAVALDTSVPAVKSLLVRARVGLVEAIEARDADCSDIRHDLAASYDKGVRASGRARRHLRECSGCTTYRAQLRGVRQGFAALSPAHAAPGLLTKLIGLGSATGGGAAAAGGAASGTGVIVGGGTAALSVCKVAAVVGCAAALTGGAVEVQRIVAPVKKSATPTTAEPVARAVAHSAPAAMLASVFAPSAPGRSVPLVERERRSRPAAADEEITFHPATSMKPAFVPDGYNPHGTGGLMAPAAVATVPEEQAAAPGEDDAVVPAAVDDTLGLPAAEASQGTAAAPGGGPPGDGGATAEESSSGSPPSSASRPPGGAAPSGTSPSGSGSTAPSSPGSSPSR